MISPARQVLAWNVTADSKPFSCSIQVPDKTRFQPGYGSPGERRSSAAPHARNSAGVDSCDAGVMVLYEQDHDKNYQQQFDSADKSAGG